MFRALTNKYAKDFQLFVSNEKNNYVIKIITYYSGCQKYSVRGKFYFNLNYILITY